MDIKKEINFISCHYVRVHADYLYIIAFEIKTNFKRILLFLKTSNHLQSNKLIKCFLK